MSVRVSDFVKIVPETARAKLPRDLQKFRVSLMPWLSQLYYTDKNLHYELAKLPTRYGDNRLELGFHFESRDHKLNELLLAGFERSLFEVRDALGDQWFAEPWDRGWTKVYTTVEYQVMDKDLVEEVAQQLADAIRVMEPIYRHIVKAIPDGNRR